MRNKGFTLVEIMLALAVMGILVTLAIPNFRSWIQSSQIRTAAESVQNGLQLARAEAAHRNTLVSFSLNGNDWSVDVIPVGAASSVFYATAANIQKRPNAEGSRNAVITSPQNSITFNSVGQVVPAPLNTISISVTNPAGGLCAPAGDMHCLNIQVEAGGKVFMCDPVLNGTGNSQACTP